MATQKRTVYVFLGPAFWATFATNTTYMYCAVVQIPHTALCSHVSGSVNRHLHAVSWRQNSSHPPFRASSPPFVLLPQPDIFQRGSRNAGLVMQED